MFFFGNRVGWGVGGGKGYAVTCQTLLMLRCNMSLISCQTFLMLRCNMSLVSCQTLLMLRCNMSLVSCQTFLMLPLQHVPCHLPDALDATLQHVSCLLPDENVFRSIMSKWNLRVKRVNGDTRRMARSALTRNGQP